MQEGIYHVPVMLQEVIDGLQMNPSGIYVDCTFGGGGHSFGILKQLNVHGKLIAFDQDADAFENQPVDDRVIFVPHNFRHLQRFLRFNKIPKVNGILADLGVSSHQLDHAERGFSTRYDAPLDMRMNQKEKKNAVSVVNDYPEEKLHKIFEQYGEVTNSKTLAHLIVQVRKLHSLNSITDFKNALYPLVKGNPEKYFAKVFQAIRIEVNDELGALMEMLQQVPEVLMDGGRIVMISFHSIEDRMVKNFFKNGDFEEVPKEDLYGIKKKSGFKIITKKPLTPSPEELKNNPRSRSAKMRIAEKIKVSKEN
jgi:16S rRNA (cytosine1402-N4)-methyltransferase